MRPERTLRPGLARYAPSSAAVYEESRIANEVCMPRILFDIKLSTAVVGKVR